MAYSSPDDVRKVWRYVYSSGLTPEEVQPFIGNADAHIDAMLASRYTVPFASEPSGTPAIIRNLSARLAFMDIVDRFPTTPDWVVRMIERAERQLELLASGGASIPGVGERTDIGAVTTSTEDYTPTFGAVPSLGEIFDSDRALDEAEARDPQRDP